MAETGPGENLNAEVLQRLAVEGDDLSQPRDIEFAVIFASEETAENFCRVLATHGYSGLRPAPPSHEFVHWDVIVTRNMIPELAAIGEMEAWLDALASPLGGSNDGWGCFAVTGEQS
jgi:hypothetical protein